MLFQPATEARHQAELLAADAVKLPDGRLFFAFIQKGGTSVRKKVATDDVDPIRIGKQKHHNLYVERYVE